MPIEFVAEEHKKTEGRKLVHSKIDNMELTNFFIEYPNQISRGGRPLQGVLDELHEKYKDRLGPRISDEEMSPAALVARKAAREDVEMRLAPYFNDLKPGDGEPNIRELTTLAVSNGIRVVPVDMSVGEVSEAYSRLLNHTHQLSTKEWKTPESDMLSPVAYEKLALRNNHMAETIARNMPDKGAHALFLCGANHFKPAVTPEEIEGRGWPNVNPLGVDKIFAELRPDVRQRTRFTAEFSEADQKKLREDNARLGAPDPAPTAPVSATTLRESLSHATVEPRKEVAAAGHDRRLLNVDPGKMVHDMQASSSSNSTPSAPVQRSQQLLDKEAEAKKDNTKY